MPNINIQQGGDPPRVWDHTLEKPGCAFSRSIGDNVAKKVRTRVLVLLLLCPCMFVCICIFMFIFMCLDGLAYALFQIL